jgi:hypothetical protein
MKLVRTISLILFAAMTIIACKDKQEKPNSGQIEDAGASTNENPLPREQELTFQKTLTLQNFTFDIQTTGAGSIRELTIQPKGLEIENQAIVLELDGQVVNAEIEDLNSDGFPEVLIFTTSAGSGSYGNVIGYSVNNGKSVSQIYFPDITENKEASSGYMGHDEFALVETSLMRRFPIYNPGDPNSNPTGGIRQIQYSLRDGEASRVFVIEEISQY